MLNVIEVGPQVNVDDPRLALHNGLCHSVYRLVRCPFRPVSMRPRLEISFEDRLQNELESPPCTTRSRIAGIGRIRTSLPASFGISFRARIGRYVFETS